MPNLQQEPLIGTLSVNIFIALEWKCGFLISRYLYPVRKSQLKDQVPEPSIEPSYAEFRADIKKGDYSFVYLFDFTINSYSQFSHQIFLLSV